MCNLPDRGANFGRKRIVLSVFFMENAMNSLSERAALSELIKIHCRYAFPDELAKLTYHAKRVHLVRMNTLPPIEILVAKRG